MDNLLSMLSLVVILDKLVYCEGMPPDVYLVGADGKWLK